MPARSDQTLAWRRLSGALLSTVLLGGCTAPALRPPPPPPPTAAQAAQMLAAIHAAGAGDHSVLQVHPLQSAGVDALAAQAHAAVQAGDYATAATLLDAALQREPQAPDLLQARAAVALALGQWTQAQDLALRAVHLGPRAGALCARSWQTLAEAVRAQGDAAGAAAARRRVAVCRGSGAHGG